MVASQWSPNKPIALKAKFPGLSLWGPQPAPSYPGQVQPPLSAQDLV